MSKFKVANNGGDDWLICWTGQDEKGVHWNVTTNQVHASEFFQFSKGAEEDARLIARLLDMHYTGQLIHTESIQNKLANYDAQAEQLKQVEVNYDALQTPMPCGHLARYAVNGEEGTQYCCMCEREALMTASEVAANVLSKTVDCVQLLREVDNRVPGLLYDHYDENTVSLGVRINNAIIELDKVNNQ